MIVLAWFAAAVGLVFTRQFFREVRWTSRLTWGLLALATVGMVAFAVSPLREEHRLIVLFELVTTGGIASVLWFIWRYSRMERWWRHTIGNTIVFKDVSLLGLLVLFEFGLVGFRVTPWVSLAFLGVMPLIMIWRTEAWQRIHDNPDKDASAGPAKAD